MLEIATDLHKNISNISRINSLILSRDSRSLAFFHVHFTPHFYDYVMFTPSSFTVNFPFLGCYCERKGTYYLDRNRTHNLKVCYLFPLSCLPELTISNINAFISDSRISIDLKFRKHEIVTEEVNFKHLTHESF